MKNLRLPVAALALMGLFSPASSGAADLTWNGGNGAWTNGQATNWQGSATFHAYDSALFGQTGGTIALTDLVRATNTTFALNNFTLATGDGVLITDTLHFSNGAFTLDVTGAGGISIRQADGVNSGYLQLTDNVVLEAAATNALNGDGIFLKKDAVLSVSALNGTTKNTAVTFNGVDGGIGGTFHLEQSTAIGYLNSASLGAGLIQGYQTSGTKTLTVDFAAGTSSFSGVMQDGSGSLTFVKAGAGTQVLSGSSNYTGGTTINSGTLVAGQSASLGATTSTVTINDGGVLQTSADFTTQHALVVGSGAATFDTIMFNAEVGSISGAGRLNKLGSGELAITANSTFLGDLAITEGYLKLTSGHTLQLGNGGSGGSLSGRVVNDGAITFNRAGLNLYSGSMSGSGSITKDGELTTLLLTGENTFTGGTTINAGRLQIGDGGSTGSLTGPIHNHSELVVNRSGTTSLGAIDGTGSLSIKGTGTVSLTAANSYIGSTNLDGGTLRLDHADALAGTYGIFFNGGTLQFTSAATADISNHFATDWTQQFRLDTNGQNITVGSALTGTASTLTKLGAGRLTLTATNSYHGATEIAGGTLVLGINNTLYEQTAVRLTADGSTLDVNGKAQSIGSLTGVAGSTVNLAGGNLVVGLDNRDTVFEGSIVDTTPGYFGIFSKVGSGTLTLRGGANYGTTFVDGGFVALENAGVHRGDVYLSNGAGLRLLNDIDTFFPIRISLGGGVINVTSGTSSIGGDLSSMFETETLTKTGAGALLVHASALQTTFGGTTYVNQGRLDLSYGNAAGSVTMPVVNVASGATFGVSGAATSVAGQVSGSGTFAVTSGVTTLTGTTASGIHTRIDGGATLRVGSNGISGWVTGDVDNDGTFAFRRSDSTTYGGHISGPGRVALDVGSLTLSGSNTYTGGTVISGGTMSISHDSALGAVSGPLTMNGGTLRTTGNIFTARQILLAADSSFDLSNETYLTYDSSVSGFGGLAKIGTGYLTLNGAQTYTGATTVQGGFFKIESGSLASSSVHLSSASFLLSNSTGVLAANITGSGTFARGGTGTSLLTGTVGLGVLTRIDSGTLQIGNAGVSGHIEGNVENEGTLSVNRTDAYTYTGAISGHGTVRQAGSGTTTFSGSNSYTGDTFVDAGHLRVDGSIAGAVVVRDGGTLGGNGVIQGSVTVENGGTLSPGNSPGLLTVEGDLTLNEHSVLRLEFAAHSFGFYDQIDVQGFFTAAGILNLVIVDGYNPEQGNTFIIFTGENPGYDAGSFTLVSNLGGGLSWDTSRLASDGIVEVVPEPSTYGLLVLGLIALSIFRRLRIA